MKLTTDKALSILIDSEQAKKVLKPSYIRQVKHRLKTGKNLELSKKIEILERLGAVANELTWNVKTNGKTDLVIDTKKQGKWEVSQHHPMTNQRGQASRQVLSENEIEIARRQSLQAKSRQVQPNLSMSSDPTDLI